LANVSTMAMVVCVAEGTEKVLFEPPPLQTLLRGVKFKNNGFFQCLRVARGLFRMVACTGPVRKRLSEVHGFLPCLWWKFSTANLQTLYYQFQKHNLWHKDTVFFIFFNMRLFIIYLLI
jgi:hypothetical protein